jgi:hypothetical protein
MQGTEASVNLDFEIGVREVEGSLPQGMDDKENFTT